MGKVNVIFERIGELAKDEPYWSGLHGIGYV